MAKIILSLFDYTGNWSQPYVDAGYEVARLDKQNGDDVLPTFLGPPKMYFDSCDYGDPYTKKTALWGNFNQPIKNRIQPTQGSKMHLIPPGPNRANLRSATPKGFAKAFFEANP